MSEMKTEPESFDSRAYTLSIVTWASSLAILSSLMRVSYFPTSNTQFLRTDREPNLWTHSVHLVLSSVLPPFPSDSLPHRVREKAPPLIADSPCVPGNVSNTATLKEVGQLSKHPKDPATLPKKLVLRVFSKAAWPYAMTASKQPL